MMMESSPGEKTWNKVLAAIRRIPPGWLLVLPLLLLIPTIWAFPYSTPDAAYSDITISHFPNAIFLRETIKKWGEIPLWSSTILGGYPFAANPLSGLWYPAGWLAYLLPIPLGFNLLVGLHLIWGGLGLYKLARSEGLGVVAAVLAGISFGLLPKLFTHYGAGHLTLLYAVPWTPWLLWSARRYSSDSEGTKLFSGLILALIFLADVRWGAFAAATWWAYSLVHLRKRWQERIRYLVLQTGLAMLLAAPLLVPLVEYSRLSSRSGMSPEDVLAHSLPLVNLLGLIFPIHASDHEWEFYMGGIITLLAISGLLLSQTRRRKYFWGMLILVSLLVAVGDQIPGSGWVADLPLVSLLRVPARALFLTGLGIASLAGYGLDAVLSGRRIGRYRILSLVLFAAVIFVLMLYLGSGYLTGDVDEGMVWGTLGVIIAATWIGIGISGRLPAKVWTTGVFLLAMLELTVFDLDSFSGKSVEQVLSERADVAVYVAEQGGDSRTYSPSYSLPQQTAVLHEIRITDGVDPLQVAGYTRFMDQASGVPRGGYSVTIPYFAAGQPRSDNAGYTPDARKLGLLNVSYVLSDFEIYAEGLNLERQMGAVNIYRNEYQRFPAWVETEPDSGQNGIEPAKVIRRSANRIQVAADGPGILTLPEIHYPGWRVWVDGVENEVLILEDILMGVEISPGAHTIEFIFKPGSVYLGLGLFIAGLSLLAWSLRSIQTGRSRG